MHGGVMADGGVTSQSLALRPRKEGEGSSRNSLGKTLGIFRLHDHIYLLTAPWGNHCHQWYSHKIVDKKNKIGLVQVAQLIRASSQYAKVVGSIPSLAHTRINQ